MKFNFPIKSKKIVLALGAESAGNFSVFKNGKIYFSEDFGDLLEEKNWHTFQKAVLAFLKKEKLTPNVVLTDLHPLFRTTLWGEALTKRFNAKHEKVQHHHAHVFSTIGDRLVNNTSYIIPNTFYGISIDGTGLGTDEHIWGGECFAVKSEKLKVKSLKRIGHLENQILLGGEIAIREPARILISVLGKFMKKDEVYSFVKKYYSKNEFEVLYNQLQQNFNCLETSSTGRVLDAISLLLGFCGNERKEKHGPTYLLEKNSTTPYLDLKPKIIEVKTNTVSLENSKFILDTTYLFKYVLKYVLKKDKNLSADEAGRLAATTQLYIAQGLHEIIKHDLKAKKLPACRRGTKANILLSGGLAENHIIKNYFASQGFLENKKSDVPRGDAGLSFGQITYLLLT